MGRDSSGNYVPGMSGPVIDTLPLNVKESVTVPGHGNPNGVIPGIPGWKYEDVDTGNVWLKLNGNNNVGWVQVSTNAFTPGGGGGGNTGGIAVGHWGGSTPTIIPNNPQLNEDLDTGKLWFWNGFIWEYTGTTLPLS